MYHINQIMEFSIIFYCNIWCWLPNWMFLNQIHGRKDCQTVFTCVLPSSNGGSVRFHANCWERGMENAIVVHVLLMSRMDGSLGLIRPGASWVLQNPNSNSDLMFSRRDARAFTIISPPHWDLTLLMWLQQHTDVVASYVMGMDVVWDTTWVN